MWFTDTEGLSWWRVYCVLQTTWERARICSGRWSPKWQMEFPPNTSHSHCGLSACLPACLSLCLHACLSPFLCAVGLMLSLTLNLCCLPCFLLWVCVLNCSISFDENDGPICLTIWLFLWVVYIVLPCYFSIDDNDNNVKMMDWFVSQSGCPCGLYRYIVSELITVTMMINDGLICLTIWLPLWAMCIVSELMTITMMLKWWTDLSHNLVALVGYVRCFWVDDNNNDVKMMDWFVSQLAVSWQHSVEIASVLVKMQQSAWCQSK